MYSENEKISLRQLKRLIVFDFFGIISLIVPYLITITTGYDGILAIVIGGVLAILYLIIILYFSKNIKGSYLTFAKNSVGRVLTFIISGLYVFKFAASLIMTIKLFTEVVNQTLLESYSNLSIIVLMVGVAGYIAYKGCEVRARVSEVLYFIVLVPVIIFLVFGIKNIDLGNITPIFYVRFDFTMIGAVSYFLLFNLLELILFIKPFVKPDPKKPSLEKSMFSYSVQSIIITVVFSLLFFCLTVGTIGEKAAASRLWSSVSIMQFLQLPGTFLNRQDSLLLALWLLTIGSVLSGFLYYICYIMKDMFKVRSKNCLMPLIMILILVASAVPMDLEDCFLRYMKYLMYIGLPQSIIIPLLLILVDRVRNNPAKVKKASIIALFLLMLPTLTGCSETVEIEDKDFVQALSISYEDNQLKVDFVLPDLGAVSEQGESGEQSDLVRSFTGTDMYNIEEQYKLCSAKKLDYSHLKAIILSKSLCEDNTIFRDFVEYAEDNYDISKNTYVFLADTKIEDIVAYNDKVQDGIGYYLERLYRNNLVTSEKDEITLGDLINEKNNEDLSIHLPLLTIFNKSLSIQGEGIVKDSTLLCEIQGEDSIYTDILRSYGENGRIFLREDMSGNNGSVVVRLNQVRLTKDIVIQNGKPLYRATVESGAIIEKGLDNYRNITVSEKLNLYKKIQELLNKQLETKLTEQMIKITREQGIDYLNIFQMTRYKNRELYAFYKDKQRQFLEELQFEVHVNIKIQ